MKRSIATVTLLAGIVMTAGVAPAIAASTIPPGGDPLGVPYAEWAARYGLWLANLPDGAVPPTMDCQADQGGDAFYLPYALPEASEATTTCSMPPGTPILVAIAPSFRDLSYCPDTEEALRTCMERDLQTVASDLSLTVDGEPVPAVEDHAVVSPLFDVAFGESGAVAGEAGTTAQAMVSGWFVMLEPLSAGTHEIQIRSTIHDDEAGDMPFALNATIEVE